MLLNILQRTWQSPRMTCPQMSRVSRLRTPGENAQRRQHRAGLARPRAGRWFQTEQTCRQRHGHGKQHRNLGALESNGDPGEGGAGRPTCQAEESRGSWGQGLDVERIFSEPRDRLSTDRTGLPSSGPGARGHPWLQPSPLSPSHPKVLTYHLIHTEPAAGPAWRLGTRTQEFTFSLRRAASCSK